MLFLDPYFLVVVSSDRLSIAYPGGISVFPSLLSFFLPAEAWIHDNQRALLSNLRVSLAVKDLSGVGSALCLSRCPTRS
ncbi:hypothetical protein [Thermoleptolyngbya sp.]